MRKIAFLDRDGCLIEEPSDYQVDALDKIRLMPFVVPSLLKLKDAGYELVMVTNQDGLGTKSFPEKDFTLCQDFMLDLFKSQGIHFDAIYICPHFDKDRCLCRKPKTGLLTDYLSSTTWQRESSIMVGDRQSDMELAANLGVKGYQISQQASWQQIVHEVLDKPRKASIHRGTKETKISVIADLDGSGVASIKTGIGFLDHMLESFSKHAKIDLSVLCEGDLWVDEHHTAEDIALALGKALLSALSDKRGIERFGFLLPMDEALCEVALDLSGRSYFVFEGSFKREAVGGLATELVPHFFRSLAEALGANIHMKVTGDNEHHKIEAMFKSFAKAFHMATRKDKAAKGEIPSTKGVL